MESQLAKLLEIVRRGNGEEIDTARGLVKPELLPGLLEAYWRMPDWDAKSNLMLLFSDHLTSEGRAVMLDFLAAPVPSPMHEDHYMSGKIAALCQLAGTFEFAERCWDNRPLCRAVIQRALAGETPSLALVDKLEASLAETSPKKPSNEPKPPPGAPSKTSLRDIGSSTLGKPRKKWWEFWK